MNRQAKAESLGIQFEKIAPGYLNLCVRSGIQLLTSGHVSTVKGKVGRELTTQQGYDAARDCAAKILNSVWNEFGTLDGLRVVKVLGCVNSDPEFIEQHLVINGASDLFHEIFGKDGDGYHARSALGFASLPTGAAVEVEAIFEVKNAPQT
jgi:enamine deaminase RidA (YjgF/YER057c/UK114 family)